MKKIVILGSTGSVGTNALKVVSDLPDDIEIVGLGAGGNVETLIQQTKTHTPHAVSIADVSKVSQLQSALPESVKIYAGEEGLIALATLKDADLILIAIVGTAGLAPALSAIRAGKDIAIASKEILVLAGEIIMQEAKQYGVRVLTVDSEHSAVFQCLDGKPTSSVRSLILTASGGPFRTLPKEKFIDITLEDALQHPTWKMGKKITIDSATMFNKGLEIIEARWLFDIDMARIKVLVHPQSIVHSMVEFIDGSVLAQLSTPDMCLPIQYAFTYPERVHNQRVQTNFAELPPLTFEEPDYEKFPSLVLARKAGEIGGTLPAVLNAANESAVEAFCMGTLPFVEISTYVSKVMNAHKVIEHPTLEMLLEADHFARQSR